jgi:type I restriction enzyme, R subunit
MYSFNEDQLEEATLNYLEELGYEIIYAPEISPDGEFPEREEYSDVLLEGRLQDALQRINPHIPEEALQDAFRKIKIPHSPGLHLNNRNFQRMITDGIDVQYTRKDGSIKTDKVWVFDYEKEDNNDWLATNQFTVIENNVDKRPDIVVFVNGIPLVVIELKSFIDEEVGISEAYNQLQTYKKYIQSLFVYNSFIISSDGINARVGTITSNEDRFMLWRTIDGVNVESLSIPQLEVLIKGMMEKERFLDIIKHFVLYQSDGSELNKILAGYHQYQASNKAFLSTLRAVEEKEDHKIGIIWHTQGSGKSLSMVFYTGKLVLGMDNPTIVVVTDRNDLDDQLFTTFSKSKDLLRQIPIQADSRNDLRGLLSRESGGIIFTTIQKFTPGEDGDAMPVLTERKNVIVIADEAHRSQYGFNARIVKQNDEASIKYGYAKYMREALPNASYIGFTATPIELTDKNTPAVFGDYIDIYDMTRSVEDKTTVKIYYESRVVKLDLPDEEKRQLDAEYNEITEYQEVYQKEKIKNKWTRLESIVGAGNRIKLIAQDIVNHYETKQEAIFGKAMIVTMSRRIAIDLYKEIIALRPEWHSDDDDKGLIKIVITGSSSDPLEWQPFIGNKKRREFFTKRMKDENDSLKIVIVRDMWLTGFDAPSLHTIYIDKPMKGHNLMQAIARVNRVFRDKPGGLIVDYIGIADQLKNALARYTDSDRKTTGLDASVAVDLMLEKYELVKDLLYGFDYNKFFTGTPGEKMQTIVAGINFVLGLGKDTERNFIKYVTELSQAYALCATTQKAKELNIEVGFFKAIKSGLVKMIVDETGKIKTKAQIDAQIRQLVSKSIISDEVIDVLEVLGLKRPNLAVLSDEFLENVKKVKFKNLAVELLKRLLKGKVKIISRKNLIQSKKFSEMIENTIKRYQNRTIETTQVILELIELAKEMNKSHKRGEDLGLSTEELAFYDALGTNESAVKLMGDDILKQIARELAFSIRKNMSIDWNLRESVRAKMRVMIKRLLKKYKYPPDQQPEAVKTVMKQAELMCQEDEIKYEEYKDDYTLMKAAEDKEDSDKEDSKDY